MPDVILDADNAAKNKTKSLPSEVYILVGKKSDNQMMIKCKAMMNTYVSASLTRPVSLLSIGAVCSIQRPA